MKTPSTEGPDGEIGWMQRGEGFPTELTYSKDKETGEIKVN